MCGFLNFVWHEYVSRENWVTRAKKWNIHYQDVGKNMYFICSIILHRACVKKRVKKEKLWSKQAHKSDETWTGIIITDACAIGLTLFLWVLVSIDTSDVWTWRERQTIPVKILKRTFVRYSWQLFWCVCRVL
jgi:hypothetical protein